MTERLNGTLGTFNYDNLFSGDFDVVTDSANVAGDLKRGTVLGLITETGQAVAVDSSATDGSESAYAVLAEDAVEAGDHTVYLTGEFNVDALIFGGSDTADTHKQELRQKGIFV